MDATLEENKGLASKYGVQGFPTLKARMQPTPSIPPFYHHPTETIAVNPCLGFIGTSVGAQVPP